MTTLKECCTLLTDGDWIESKDQSASGIRLIQTGNIGNGEYLEKESRAKYISEDTFSHLSCTEIFPGDILISRLPDPVGRACIIPPKTERMITAVDCSILRVDKNVVDTEYLQFFLMSNSYFHQLTAKLAGTTRVRISRKNLEKVTLRVPDKDIQKHAVDILNRVANTIKMRKKEIQCLDELIKARFVELTNKGKTTPTRMGDVATYINGYAFKPSDWEDDGLPIIRIQNLNDAKAPYNHYSGIIDEKYHVKSGDVLVSWATHLEAYIWNGGDAWLNQHIFRVSFDKMPINKVYFVYSTEEALRQAFKNAHGFKPTMEHIKRSDFEKAIVELPSLEIQEQFAAFVAQVDKSKVAVQNALDEAQVLFDSLMQQYFG